jgi:NAD+ kinase
VSQRTVLLVTHTGRRAAVAAARELAGRLAEAGLDVRVLEGEAAAIGCSAVTVVPADAQAGEGAELVVALGGDGTLLRAAEFARPANAALLGVNLGHVGFLAEAERSDLESTVERILQSSYDVEERLTLDVVVRRGERVVVQNWALNDATVEKASRQRMLDLLVEVDGRPLSRWSGDGVVCATPTGSTAYAFSAGGPVVWPSVQALLVVPISAHALFARPLVVSPDSRVAVELLSGAGGAIAFCDGRRTLELAAHDRIEISRGAHPIRLVRLTSAAFTDRLVSKFHLSVRGWRGPTEDERPAGD